MELYDPPSAAVAVVGTTAITGGTASGLLWNNASVLASGPAITDATGNISIPAAATFRGGNYAGVNASGTNATAAGVTIINALSTGNATNPNLVFQVGVKGGSGSGLATATGALTLVGETLAANFQGTVTVGTGGLQFIALNANGAAVVPVVALGLTLGNNFSNSNGEVNFWNQYSSVATQSFDFRQVTGSGTSGSLMKISPAGGVLATATFQSAAPAGASAGLWKLGSLVTGAVVLDTTRSVYVDIGGVVYKVLVST